MRPCDRIVDPQRILAERAEFCFPAGVPPTDPARPDLGELTHFLNELGAGHPEAEADLMPLLVAELQRIARSAVGGDRVGETLQPTALVNSAYVKLFGTSQHEWESRKHFFVVAAQAMRQLIIDHARYKGRDKRGGGVPPVTLNEGIVADTISDDELLDLDEALNELEALEPRQARVVELRYFAGLEVEEAAKVLEVSKTTVERDWRFARAWLTKRIGRGLNARGYLSKSASASFTAACAASSPSAV